MKYVVVFESIGGTGVDGVEDQRRGRESNKMFGKGVMFKFGPFLDPIALLFDQLRSVDTKIVM
jgi:hypothetical protein